MNRKPPPHSDAWKVAGILEEDGLQATTAGLDGSAKTAPFTFIPFPAEARGASPRPE